MLLGYFFSLSKLHKKESAGKMVIEFHISQSIFFLSFASTEQNNLEALSLDRKSFSLPGFYFGFSTLLSRKIIQFLPSDHFHLWLRVSCLETLSKCISEVLFLLRTHTLLSLMQELYTTFSRKEFSRKNSFIHVFFPPDKRNCLSVGGPRRALQEHSPVEDLG